MRGERKRKFLLLVALLLCLSAYGQKDGISPRLRGILKVLFENHSLSASDMAFVVEKAQSGAVLERVQAILYLEHEASNGYYPALKFGRLAEARIIKGDFDEAFMCGEAYRLYVSMPNGGGILSSEFSALTEPPAFHDNSLSPKELNLIPQALRNKNIANRILASQPITLKRNLKPADTHWILDQLAPVIRDSKGREKQFWHSVDRIVRAKNKS